MNTKFNSYLKKDDVDVSKIDKVLTSLYNLLLHTHPFH